MHHAQPGIAPWGRVSVCGRVIPSTMSYSTDPGNTTCKRCLQALAKQVEAQLSQEEGVHFLVNPGQPRPYLCAARRTLARKGTHHANYVTCTRCLDLLLGRAHLRRRAKASK